MTPDESGTANCMRLEPTSIEDAVKLLGDAWKAGVKTLVGDALPAAQKLDDSIALVSLANLNQIIEVDRINALVIAEAGASVDSLRVATDSLGWWCPALRWERGNTSLGAAIAGGHGWRSRHFGAVRDYLLGTQFVSPATGLVRHGSKAIKNATGFNLTAMVAGSRGELGVILQAILRLVPKSPGYAARQFAFSDPLQAWTAAQALADVSLGAEAVAVATPLAEGGSTVVVEVEADSRESAEFLLVELTRACQARRGEVMDHVVWPECAVPSSATLFRSAEPTQVADVASHLRAAAREHNFSGWLRGEATGGALEVCIPMSQRAVVESAFADAITSAGEDANPVRGILREAFDPQRRLGAEAPVDILSG